MDKARHDNPNLYLPNAETWVADCNGTIVGFIALIGNEIGAVVREPRLLVGFRSSSQPTISQPTIVG